MTVSPTARFNEEVKAGQPVQEAVAVMLATQGHTVLVSGCTLCLCFLCMLLIPVSTISTMGVRKPPRLARPAAAKPCTVKAA